MSLNNLGDAKTGQDNKVGRATVKRSALRIRVGMPTNRRLRAPLELGQKSESRSSITPQACQYEPRLQIKEPECIWV